MSNIFKSLKSVTITRDYALLHCQSPIKEFEAPSRTVDIALGGGQTSATVLNDIEVMKDSNKTLSHDIYDAVQMVLHNGGMDTTDS